MEDVAEDVPDDGDPDERFEFEDNEGNDIDRRDDEGRGQVNKESGIDGVSNLKTWSSKDKIFFDDSI